MKLSIVRNTVATLPKYTCVHSCARTLWQQQALNWAVCLWLSVVLSARDGLLPAGGGPISTWLSLHNTQLAPSLSALAPNILSLTSHCQTASLRTLVPSLSLWDSLPPTSENNIIHILEIIRSKDILLLYSSILHQVNFTTHQLIEHFPVELSSLPVNVFIFYFLLFARKAV